MGEHLPSGLSPHSSASQRFQPLPDAGELGVTDTRPLIARNLSQKERKSMAASSHASQEQSLMSQG